MSGSSVVPRVPGQPDELIKAPIEQPRPIHEEGIHRLDADILRRGVTRQQGRQHQQGAGITEGSDFGMGIEDMLQEGTTTALMITDEDLH